MPKSLAFGSALSGGYHEDGMNLPRRLGRWALAGLMINGVIGSGIFGVPAELNRLLGRASPLAMLFAALATGVLVASFAEVASQFPESGGVYLYVRTAFGRFAGIQVGWFWLLSALGAAAAAANIFVTYLASLWPGAAQMGIRAGILTVLVAVPALANCLGVRRGANLSSALAVAKLLPLGLLIALGLARFGRHLQVLQPREILAPGWGSWSSALLLLLFVYDGYEDSLVPSGEIQDPRRSIPFALFAGLLVTAGVYTLLQFITVATQVAQPSDHPLADSAAVLIGRGGAATVALAVMCSAYGWISQSLLTAPRLPAAFSAQGDGLAFLARLHPRFQTPQRAIAMYAFLVWGLALTGTFLWAVLLSAGSQMIYTILVCASLIRLRRMRSRANALRVPGGSVVALAGIGMALAMLTRLDRREIRLMGLTALLAATHWWLLCRHARSSPEPEPRSR